VGTRPLILFPGRPTAAWREDGCFFGCLDAAGFSFRAVIALLPFGPLKVPVPLSAGM
jgi:hypothetical protein